MDVTALMEQGRYRDIANWRDVHATRELFAIWSDRLEGIKKANESTHSSFGGCGNRSTAHLSLRMDSGKIRLANRGGLGKSLDTYLLQLGAPMPRIGKALVRSSNNTARDFSPIVFRSSQSNLPVWTDGLRMRQGSLPVGWVTYSKSRLLGSAKTTDGDANLGSDQPRRSGRWYASGLRDRDQPFRMETAKLLASLNPPAFEVLQDALEDSDAVVGRRLPMRFTEWGVTRKNSPHPLSSACSRTPRSNRTPCYTRLLR